MENGKTNTAQSTLTSSSTSSFATDLWSTPERIQVNENIESIEMIYKQYSQCQTHGFNSKQQERVFKIIFSCVDGKWNKSAPIFGTITPATQEDYDFDVMNYFDVKEKLPEIGTKVKVFYETEVHAGHGHWRVGTRISETHFELGDDKNNLHLIDISNRQSLGKGVTHWADISENNLPNLCRLHTKGC